MEGIERPRNIHRLLADFVVKMPTRRRFWVGQSQIQLGWSLAFNGDISAGISLVEIGIDQVLRALGRSHSEVRSAITRLADFLIDADATARAEQYLDMIIEKGTIYKSRNSTKDGLPYVVMARLFIKQGKLSEAELTLEKATDQLSISPDHTSQFPFSRFALLSAQGELYQLQAESSSSETEQSALFTQAIERFSEADRVIHEIEPSHPLRSSILVKLSKAYLSLHKRLGKIPTSNNPIASGLLALQDARTSPNPLNTLEALIVQAEFTLEQTKIQPLADQIEIALTSLQTAIEDSAETIRSISSAESVMWLAPSFETRRFRALSIYLSLSSSLGSERELDLKAEHLFDQQFRSHSSRDNILVLYLHDFESYNGSLRTAALLGSTRSLVAIRLGEKRHVRKMIERWRSRSNFEAFHKIMEPTLAAARSIGAASIIIHPGSHFEDLEIVALALPPFDSMGTRSKLVGDLDFAFEQTE